MDAVSIRSNLYVDKQLQARKVEDLSLLPKEIRREIRKEAKRIATEDVFGVGHATDKAGNPIEQGIGAPGNMSQHCIDAYISEQTQRRKEPEAGFEDTLKRMRAQLAECQAKRRAAKAAEDDDD